MHLTYEQIISHQEWMVQLMIRFEDEIRYWIQKGDEEEGIEGATHEWETEEQIPKYLSEPPRFASRQWI